MRDPDSIQACDEHGLAMVLTGVAIGAALACASPWAHKELVGPFHLSAFVWPFVTHIYPNLLFTAAIFFSLVALTRQMLPNYIGGVVLLIGYLASRSLTANLDRLVALYGETAA